MINNAKIFNEQINKNDYHSSLKNAFAHFETNIFDKLQYYTNLNSKRIPKTLTFSFLNMLIFLLILIASIFIIVLDLNEYISSYLSIILISLFIANTFDLIIIAYRAIKSELKLDEIIKL